MLGMDAFKLALKTFLRFLILETEQDIAFVTGDKEVCQKFISMLS